MIAERFARLLVIAPDGKTERGESLWLCECDCGGLTSATTARLRSAHKRSCGCLRIETGRANGLRARRHGHTSGPRRSPTWISWSKMRERVLNPKHVKHHLYADVSIDPRWESFESFLGDMGERPDGTSLDRIDPYGDYSPANCRWATPLEQRHNRRAAA